MCLWSHENGAPPARRCSIIFVLQKRKTESRGLVMGVFFPKKGIPHVSHNIRKNWQGQQWGPIKNVITLFVGSFYKSKNAASTNPHCCHRSFNALPFCITRQFSAPGTCTWHHKITSGLSSQEVKLLKKLKQLWHQKFSHVIFRVNKCVCFFPLRWSNTVRGWHHRRLASGWHVPRHGSFEGAITASCTAWKRASWRISR